MGRLLIALLTALGLVFSCALRIPVPLAPNDAEWALLDGAMRLEPAPAADGPGRGNTEFRRTIASLPEALPEQPSVQVLSRPGSEPGTARALPRGAAPPPVRWEVSASWVCASVLERVARARCDALSLSATPGIRPEYAPRGPPQAVGST